MEKRLVDASIFRKIKSLQSLRSGLSGNQKLCPLHYQWELLTQPPPRVIDTYIVTVAGLSRVINDAI
jgi:hypothetical protein